MPFRDLLGHHRLLALLSRSVRRDSLPPSLIFAGPGGVGKRRTAIAVAEALNCGSPVAAAGLEPASAAELEIDSCGGCPSCRRIARGVHSDVEMIEPGETGAIKIAQVREAIDRAMYRPFEGRRRVVVVDEADALMAQAQNALLKTLEEPPPASVFILVSSRSDALLPTVLSRCSRLRFGRLSEREIVTALTRDHGYSETDARAVGVLADGSLGRALEGRAADFAEARAAAERVLRRTAESPDSPDSADRPERFDARARLESAKELTGRKSASGPTSASDRDRLAIHLQALGSLVRDLGLLATRADGRALANLDLKPGLEGLARRFGGERALRAFTAVDRALAALERNVSPKVVADWVVLQL